MTLYIEQVVMTKILTPWQINHRVILIEGPGRIPSLKSDQSFFVSPNLAIKTVYWKVICQ